MASILKNTVGALQELAPYVLAAFATVMGVYISTVMFGFFDTNVIPNLGLSNNSTTYNITSGEISQLAQKGADGVYNVGSIVLIATSLMALAVVVKAFGFNQLDRFNIGAARLKDLARRIGEVVGVYTVIVFALMLIQTVFAYLEQTVTPSLGFDGSSWVQSSLQKVIQLLSEVISTVTPLLDLGVGLVTLGLVISAFGFEINFQFGKGSKRRNTIRQ